MYVIQWLGPFAMPVHDTAGPMGVEPIIDRLRRQTKEKRIPVIDFFKGFDSLKLKRINRSQFVRGLSSAALKVRREIPLFTSQ